jgi:hypothetical protein
MKSFLLTYDLNRPGQNYGELYEGIKNLGTWWHCLDSSWVVKHPGPATAIRDALSPFLDNNDRLIVLELTGVAAWHGFDKQCNDWLKTNL